MLSYRSNYGGSNGGGSILSAAMITAALGNTPIANTTHATNADNAAHATNADHAGVADTVSALTSAQITTALGFTPGNANTPALMSPGAIGSIAVGQDTTSSAAVLGGIYSVYGWNGTWKCLSPVISSAMSDANGGVSGYSYTNLYQRIA